MARLLLAFENFDLGKKSMEFGDFLDARVTFVSFKTKTREKREKKKILHFRFFGETSEVLWSYEIMVY